MKTTIRIASLFALLGATGTGLACDYPTKVDIPNGTTATKEEMVSAYQGVKEFVASIDAYLECIVEEEEIARLAMEDLAPEVEQAREDKLTQKYNAAVEDSEMTAERFNTEYRTFKAKEEEG